MNRILFERAEIVNGCATFSDGRAEHVLNVLHGAVGQTLKTGELDGLVGTSVITAIRDLHEREAGAAQRGSGARTGTVVVACAHTEKAPEPWFDLLLAPPRPRVLKRLLPQLTALGVGKIVLVGAAKVEKAFWGAQLLKETVYRPLLVDGLMQCGTTRVPAIRCERNFRRYVESAAAEEFSDCERIVAHPAHLPPSNSHLPPPNSQLPPPNLQLPTPNFQLPTSNSQLTTSNSQLPTHTPPRCVLAIGPEGGWMEEEVAMLESKGFRRRSLGSRILRTDTAAIALIAQMMAEKGI